MQPVSDSWKKAQKQTLVPESYVEISLKIGDPKAQADAVPSDNGSVWFSHTELLTDELEKTPIKYASFEPGLWLLDGTHRILGMEDIIPPSSQVTYDGFVPAGEKDTMLTSEWEDFYIISK